MPYTTPSVAYCTYSDVALELDLTVNGSSLTLWGRNIATSTLTNYANRGNDNVYALVGDVSSSTSYKNNLAVRLASKYGARDLVTHQALHWPDYAFNFSLGQQSVQRGAAAQAGMEIIAKRLDEEIRELEWKISATADGKEHDDTSRDTYTDVDSLPWMP